MVRAQHEDMGKAHALRKTIGGGFVLIPVSTLMATWHACRARPLGIGDFRAWLAAHEMVARRSRIADDQAPAYSPAELARLLQVSEKRARASIRRVTAAGLLTWSESSIGFAEPASQPEHAPSPIGDSIGGGRGSVVVPRRMLRFLARGARPALIATAVGVLLRCLSRRRGGFEGRGRVKATWVAQAFGVEPRRVKQARAELVELRWIAPVPSHQWAMNRWGKAYRIDLAWTPPMPTTADGPPLAPPSPDPGPILAPPESDREPLSEREENQEPGAAGLAGARLGGSGPGSGGMAMARRSSRTSPPSIARPTPPSRPSTTLSASSVPPPTQRTVVPQAGPLPPARLDDVRVEDLIKTDHLLDLHGQAVTRGLVTVSEADRLRFVAAAEHAVAVGRSNPAGLFVHLIRGRLWRYLTQADEDRASARLKARHRGSVGQGAGSMVARGLKSGRPTPSDGEVVMAVRAAAIKAGCYRDPWPEFARINPSWTRERWDQAKEGGRG